MSDQTQQQLRQAYELLKAKKRQEATEILVPLLRDNEDNVNAWWLLANALTDPTDAREALENVLRLKPDHDKAQKMLGRINELYPPAPPPEPEPEPDPGAFGSGDSASDPFAGAGSAPDSDDPFAGVDPFAATPDVPETASPADGFALEAQTFNADPFGAPVDAGGAGQRPRAAADDPFGLPDSLQSATPRSSGGARSGKSHDPFASLERKPLPADGVSRKKKGGTNPLVLILAIVGAVAVIGCIACAGIAAVGGRIAEQVVTEYGDDFLDQVGGGIVADVRSRRGNISYGEVRNDTLQTGELHEYNFTGNSGDTVFIDMTASTDLDAYLFLYDPSGTLVEFDDDSGGNYNARITYTLRSSGTFTIAAQSFAALGSGPYELRLDRR